MNQDYRALTLDQIENIEKQTLRTIVQAIQEYSREARIIFESTAADSEAEIIVLTEDLVQYALEVAECYPINKRFAGFIDYKRARWLTTPFGIFPQILLVDAKASTEDYRANLQRSQLSMDAEFVSRGAIVQLSAGVEQDMPIISQTGRTLRAITTSCFVHLHYSVLNRDSPPFRRLHAFYVLMLPHGTLKVRYNPTPETTFFKQGKHSGQRGESPRIRVYFQPLRQMCPWRIQELKYGDDEEYTIPIWRDVAVSPEGELVETREEFDYLGR